MIKPKQFRFNQETAATNIFQRENFSSGKNAAKEFDDFVKLLRENEIEVLLFDEEQTHDTPDCVFPNNWLATIDSTVFLFPMLAQNRRMERRNDILNFLQKKFQLTANDSLLHLEEENKFLEGTGAVVLDRKNKIAYGNISSRCDETALKNFCVKIDFSPVLFHASSPDGNEVYHTNVLMSIGETVAVICDSWIHNEEEKRSVMNSLKKNHSLVQLTSEQVFSFAGNMLLVKNKSGKKFWMMSSQAFHSLNENQISVLKHDGEILHSDISTIERLGGGSARCMLAEIFY